MAVQTVFLLPCSSTAITAVDNNNSLADIALTVDSSQCVQSITLSSEQLSNLDLLLASSSSLPEIIGITPLSVAESFSWGFGAIVLFWYLSYPVSIAIKLIRGI